MKVMRYSHVPFIPYILLHDHFLSGGGGGVGGGEGEGRGRGEWGGGVPVKELRLRYHSAYIEQ